MTRSGKNHSPMLNEVPPPAADDTSDVDVDVDLKPTLPATPTPTPSKKRSHAAVKSEDEDDKDQNLTATPSAAKKTRQTSDGSAWTAMQQFLMIQELVAAGKHAGVWDGIHAEINALQTDGKEKTKNRVSAAFTETHHTKFLKSNSHLTPLSPPSAIAYPSLASSGAAGWSEAQIKALWGGVMREGARRVDWEGAAGKLSEVGPMRTGRACKGTWRDTMSVRFGINPKRVKKARR